MALKDETAAGYARVAVGGGLARSIASRRTDHAGDPDNELLFSAATFATVRLRHRRTKASGSRVACLAMVFKLAQTAARTWRRLNGHALLADVIQGVQFKDGIKVHVG